MITIVFVLYALVLAALAAYLYTHRRHNFMGQTAVAATTTRQLTGFAGALVVCAAVALVAALLPLNWLRVVALLLGALCAGGLGLRLPRFMA